MHDDGFVGSGKTSLLLQFAYNHAMNKDSIVTFICKQHAFDVKPPFLSQAGIIYMST